MKAFRIFGRNIRDSFRGVYRNFSLSLASISCITITLIVVAISIILTYNANNFAGIMEKNVTIVAFLDLDITEEEIDDVETEILALDNVDAENVVFKDKMSISEDMMASSEILENVMKDYTREDSPIQDTFQVKVNNIDDISKTASEIGELENVDVVKYGEGMVERLVSVFDALKKGSIFIVVALVIVTAFLISNTIKITIFSRKREIEIMRLVGASNTNIKIPFVMEGLYLGVFGSIIPIVITCYGYTVLYDHFGGQLFTKFIKLVNPTPFIYILSLILLVIGMLVGMFGSSRAVKKYLKI